jgi:hypothetical protein
MPDNFPCVKEWCVKLPSVAEDGEVNRLEERERQSSPN